MTDLLLEATTAHMETVYCMPQALSAQPTHYCPGCTHGVAHRLLAEALDELNMRERAILVAPVGCAVFAYQYFEVDGCEAPHGRRPPWRRVSSACSPIGS